MSEKKTQKKNWFEKIVNFPKDFAIWFKGWAKGLKAEFKRIIWPDQKTLAKQSVAVVSVSVALGAIIALLDLIFQFGIDFLVNIG